MSDKRLITPEDLHAMHWVNDPAVSPVTGKIAYILKSVNTQHNGYESHIRMMNEDGSMDRAYTAGRQDASPAWSPDGSKLAFLRKQGDHRQVWTIPADGGEAAAVTDLKFGVISFKWSPDSRSLLVKASAEVSERDHKGSSEQEKLPEAVVVDRLKYKADGAGLWDGRRSHLFTVDLSAGETTQITEGSMDVGSFAWSTDGAEIAYTASTASSSCPDPDLRLTNDLFIMDRSGQSVRKLTEENLSIHSVDFTPDGTSLLLLANDLSCGFATLTRIYVLSSAGGSPRVLYPDVDIQIGHSCVSDMRAGAGTPPTFSKDGTSVYLQISREGSVQVAAFALDGSGYQIVIGGEREVYQFALTPEEKLIFAAADPLQPGDLFAQGSGDDEEIRLTNCNEKLWAGLQLSQPEMFTFQTSDNGTIQGWIMKPAGYQEGTKVPAVLEIHGGPQAMYGYTFMHEFQLLAAAGYAVFYTNPRGGHGYGQKHVNTVRGDYGGRDYQDLMEAVDYVVGHYEYVDADRLGVTGGSYGGFMTNWIVGHTNRFKAAVTQRSISNWLSFYGVSDIGYYFTEDQIWGNPWENTTKLWEHSPLAYVNQVNTPLLILHGEQDLRCPIEQGEQLFIALKRLGKDTQLVRFPGADHNLSRSGHPHLRVQRLSHIVRWFTEHIER